MYLPRDCSTGHRQQFNSFRVHLCTKARTGSVPPALRVTRSSFCTPVLMAIVEFSVHRDLVFVTLHALTFVRYQVCTSH